MKKLALAAVLVALACACARAGEPAFKKEPRVKVFGQFEYYRPENGAFGLDSQLHAQSEKLVAAGYSSASESVSNSGGSGASIGVLTDYDEHTRLGLSIGYTLGPTMNGNLSAQSAGLGDGGLTVNRAVTYFRALAHTQINLLHPHTGRPGEWNLDFDSAFGLGVGRVDQECQATGSLTCPFSSTGRTWTGFAYEFGPIATYRLRFIDVDFGARYAGFPRYQGSEEIASIRWETFGVFLGATF